jgi:hypothetical protein
MTQVDTLIVCATNRGPDVVNDQLDALRWACQGSFHVVIVEDGGKLGPAGNRDDHTILPSRLAQKKRMSGFKNQEGIRWALEHNVEFQAALCLDDDCLPIGKGFDVWALGVLEDEAADLLGVADRVQYASYWDAWRNRFTAWAPEASKFTPYHRSLFYAAIWMGRSLCEELRERDLLVPDKYEEWTLWPDVYLSWMADVLGYHAVAWGAMDAPHPPLYLNHPNAQRHAAQPWILHPDFALFHSVAAVHGFSERTVREFYARRRALGTNSPVEVTA